MMNETTYGPVELTWEDLFSLPPSPPGKNLEELAERWWQIGRRNPWIRGAYDPPFTVESIRIVSSRYELRKWLEFGNWCNGTAFAIQRDPQSPVWTEFLVFIQQGEATDEWLTIKSWPDGNGGWRVLDFESISWYHILKKYGVEYFNETLDDLFAATPEQCKELTWDRHFQRGE